MQLDYDETGFPDLGRFRKACLDNDHATMEDIANAARDWYDNENPDDLPMERLAFVFQAQHYASENDLASLQALATEQSWVINHPWTAQRWLPVSQACAHGDQSMFEFLLDAGADPWAVVGSPDDTTSVIDMARYSGHNELADWLVEVSGGDSP